MTVTLCAVLSADQGYPVFGLQYGSQCWAGNSLQQATQYGGSDQCNDICNGNKGEQCGEWRAAG